MSIFNPEWRVTIGSTIYTNVTLSGLSITSGRTDIYSQPVAGYCSLTVINLDNSVFDFQINQGMTLQLKDSTGTYRTMFGGNLTDITLEVVSAGVAGMATAASLTALGALSRLPKALTEGVLAKDLDGVQIESILTDLLVNNWIEVPAALTWADYPATETWLTAQNTGLGEIDSGIYELEARTTDVIDVYSLASALAVSGFGYLYESSDGLINYAGATHRQDYLANNGYTTISANQGLSAGIRTVTQSGDVRNVIALKWRAGTEEVLNQESIDLFGKLGQSITTTLQRKTDAEDQAQRYLDLRSFPRAKFESITFPITSPELSDEQRDALLGIFMGMPISLTDLPLNINGGQFQGFVEGFTWSVSLNSILLTINMSPIEFSLVAINWEQVNAAEQWNTLSNTLTWEQATGAVA
jgi:hypothetical protein